MTAPRQLTGRRRRRWIVRIALAAGLAVAIAALRAGNRPVKLKVEDLATAAVRRADFRSTLVVGGKTESAANTVVECQLERIEMRNEGKSTLVGGSSVITWVIDDGTTVKKGDVLCRLDSADYEELVRAQEIKVERARADLRTAELDLQVAELAVGEFRDGLMAQTIQEQEVALTLAEADVASGKDRLDWLRRMKAKGYASLAQVASGELAVQKAENDAKKARTDLDLFRRFGAPKQIQILQAEVQSTQAMLSYQQQRSARYDERLAYYKEMVDFCTIRAPHDGFVIYIPQKIWSNEAKVEAGVRVRQYQDLFYLPDLSRMRVSALVHESVMAQVRPGMIAHAKIEGLSGREIEGHVLGVDPLPDMQMSWISDTRSFKTTIALDSSPRGIRPEMTAEVSIDVGRRTNVIAVPIEAVAVEGGKDYCYVPADGLLERRPVKLGGANADLLEVTEGLEEGEEVVLDPGHLDAYASLIVDATPPGRDEPRPDVADAARPTATASEKAGF